MEGNFQTSFIPRKPLAPPAVVKPVRSVSIFSLITTIIFVITLLLSAGVFGYKWYVEKGIEKKQADLNTLIATFEPSLISELTRLDDRLNSANKLISQHVALSSFFDNLQKATIKSVRFIDFRYSLEGNRLVVGMSGQAQSFSSVALQNMEFQKPGFNKIFLNPTFSNLNLDKNGNVTFDFATIVDANSILYKNTLLAGVGLSQSAVFNVASTTSSSSTTPTVASTTSKTASSTKSTR